MTNSPASDATASSSTTGATAGYNISVPLPPTNFPFSSHQSAKICLKSALAIAHAFDELPFPNPTGTVPLGPVLFLSPTSTIVCPRTMPSFACCAMQCAYALLMVHQKTKTLYGVDHPAGAAPPFVVNSLLARLQQGLTSIYGTLANYATAFEALGGMRGEF